METTTIAQEEPTLFEQVNDYAQTQIKLFKYRAVDKGADVVSSVIAKFTVLLLLVFFFIFLNIGIALWIGALLGEAFYGFFILAGFYGLIAVILAAVGGKLVKVPMNNMLIKKMLK